MTARDALEQATTAQPGERFHRVETIRGPAGGCKRERFADDPGRWTRCAVCLAVYDDYGTLVSPIPERTSRFTNPRAGNKTSEHSGTLRVVTVALASGSTSMRVFTACMLRGCLLTLCGVPFDRGLNEPRVLRRALRSGAASPHL